MTLAQLWYQKNWLSKLLLPFSGIFCSVVQLRRFAYKRAWLRSYRSPIPVIVVGNLTVGGTGKTPLVIWLAHELTRRGWKVGIISRGYGGTRQYNEVQRVYPDSSVQSVGDEAILLARTGCPVVVAAQRHLALQYLLARESCDVILSDDGLQHYALQRDIEIAVIDGQRGLGNGYCLPAGPLRELPSRLHQVDFIVSKTIRWRNSIVMQYTSSQLHAVTTATTQSLQHFIGQTVHAIAGIGHPEAFFTMLEQQGIQLIRHSFPDHHFYRQQEITFPDALPVIMTEKDAVKCTSIADHRHWYLAITAQLPQNFGEKVVQRLQEIKYG